jgi:hypothetical protein
LARPSDIVSRQALLAAKCTHPGAPALTACADESRTIPHRRPRSWSGADREAVAGVVGEGEHLEVEFEDVDFRVMTSLVADEGVLAQLIQLGRDRTYRRPGVVTAETSQHCDRGLTASPG